ncbi:MAG: hypothetical protein MHM6MM_006287 [Cercozoa sp. M6MM]
MVTCEFDLPIVSNMSRQSPVIASWEERYRSRVIALRRQANLEVDTYDGDEEDDPWYRYNPGTEADAESEDDVDTSETSSSGRVAHLRNRESLKMSVDPRLKSVLASPIPTAPKRPSANRRNLGMPEKLQQTPEKKDKPTHRRARSWLRLRRDRRSMKQKMLRTPSHNSIRSLEAPKSPHSTSVLRRLARRLRRRGNTDMFSQVTTPKAPPNEKGLKLDFPAAGAADGRVGETCTGTTKQSVTAPVTPAIAQPTCFDLLRQSAGEGPSASEPRVRSLSDITLL